MSKGVTIVKYIGINEGCRGPSEVINRTQNGKNCQFALKNSVEEADRDLPLYKSGGTKEIYEKHQWV
jgi:hypothetical protein